MIRLKPPSTNPPETHDRRKLRLAKKAAIPAEKIWVDKSYQQRFAIFCERLMTEGIYDAICYITSSADDPRPVELVESLDWRHFSAAVTARLTYLQELGLPG